MHFVIIVLYCTSDGEMKNIQKQATRLGLVQHELKSEKNIQIDLQKVVNWTDGYSCSDLSSLCHEAAMYPLREVPRDKLASLKPEQLRSLSLDDFKSAIKIIRPSCDSKSLAQCKKWGEAYAANL